MIQRKYRLVPEWNAAFAVLEDCCYERIVFQGEIGITETIDHHNELIGTLLCCECDPNLKILEISRAKYEALRENVNSKRRAN